MMTRNPGTDRSPRQWVAVVLVLACGCLTASDAMACAVCFSTADPVATGSLNAGILVLLGITTVVLAAFARFVVSLVRRARSVQLIGDPQT